MTVTTKITIGLFAGTLALAATTRAEAESASDAYQRGQSAMKAGKVHEACQAFAASEQLEPKVDTELALASCDEQDGKPVAAAKLYRQLAQNDSNMDRRKTSASKASALEAKAPKLRITVSQRPDGLVIKVDGVEVPSTGDVMVDAGPHEVVASAPGFEGHASAAVDRDRAIVDVIVRLEPKAEPPPTPTPVPTTTTTTTTTTTSMTPAPTVVVTGHADNRKRNGVIVGAAGVVLIVGAAILTAEAYSQFNDESSLCPHSRCADQTALNQAHSDLSNGHDYRDIGYPMGIVGIAAVGFGAYLLFSGHSESQPVALDVGHDHAGLSFTSHF
jgi:hypothetical protein